MEYTELADYPIPTGVIIEWKPATAPASWRDDNRAISTNHQSHLDCYERNATFNEKDATYCEDGTSVNHNVGAWIGTAFEISGALDPSAFDATLCAWIARHDAFRTTPQRHESRPGHRRRSIGVADVDIDVTRYGRPRGGAEIYRHIEKFFATEITPHRWPHLVATTIEPCDGEGDEHFIVIVAADHSVMDAYSQLLLIAELTEIYTATVAGTTPQLPTAGSFVDYCAAEHRHASEIHLDHPATRVWNSFLHSRSDSPGMPDFPLPLQACDTNESCPAWQSSLSLWLLTEEETRAFTDACKRHGGSLSSGALTALATALLRLTGTASTQFTMPMHTRTDPESFAAAGWYVGLIPVELDLSDATEFSGALGTANADIRRHGWVAKHSYSRIAELLGIAGAPKFVVSYVDARHLPGAHTWGPADRALRSRTCSDDEVYLWINRAPGGLNISLRFPSTERAAASVHSLIAEYSAVLRAVAETGDTPLDAIGSVTDHARNPAENR